MLAKNILSLSSLLLLVGCPDSSTKTAQVIDSKRSAVQSQAAGDIAKEDAVANTASSVADHTVVVVLPRPDTTAGSVDVLVTSQDISLGQATSGHHTETVKSTSDSQSSLSLAVIPVGISSTDSDVKKVDCSSASGEAVPIKPNAAYAVAVCAPNSAEVETRVIVTPAEQPAPIAAIYNPDAKTLEIIFEPTKNPDETVYKIDVQPSATADRTNEDSKASSEMIKAELASKDAVVSEAAEALPTITLKVDQANPAYAELISAKEPSPEVSISVVASNSEGQDTEAKSVPVIVTQDSAAAIELALTERSAEAVEEKAEQLATGDTAAAFDNLAVVPAEASAEAVVVPVKEALEHETKLAKREAKAIAKIRERLQKIEKRIEDSKFADDNKDQLARLEGIRKELSGDLHMHADGLKDIRMRLKDVASVLKTTAAKLAGEQKQAMKAAKLALREEKNARKAEQKVAKESADKESLKQEELARAKTENDAKLAKEKAKQEELAKKEEEKAAKEKGKPAH